MECFGSFRMTQRRAQKGQCKVKSAPAPKARSKDEDMPVALNVETSPCIRTLEHHLLIRVLSNLDPLNLANLEATSSIFKKPANLDPDCSLNFPELAARSLCEARDFMKAMKEEQKEELKQRCGGSWKLVLKFLLCGERIRHNACPDVVAGAGHSLVLTKDGAVYTFGANSAGQLGHSLGTELWKPQLLRFPDGVRVIQAVAGSGRTMLVSNTGQVYAFGIDAFTMAIEAVNPASTFKEGDFYPKLVEQLCGISVAQVSLGHFFTAALSHEGKVYTISWGSSEKLGHACDAKNREPHLLGGALSNVPVVQIATGSCFLLALASEPNGMCVYSVGCGVGGKLGHGNEKSEKLPHKIEYFDKHNDFKPIAIAAGPWHAVALSEDGRVCTWGWWFGGCLGHGSDHFETYLPTLVTSLGRVKIVRITTGWNATFAFAGDGNVYCFGETGQVEEKPSWNPQAIRKFKEQGEQIIRISKTNALEITKAERDTHTLALTMSGKVYASGQGADGQLGRRLAGSSSTILDIDFNFE